MHINSQTWTEMDKLFHPIFCQASDNSYMLRLKLTHVNKKPLKIKLWTNDSGNPFINMAWL